jgi:hypothetical protein
MMPRFISLVASGLLLISYTAFPAPSLAAADLNILIMGEDADQDTVPRPSGAFKSVFAALSDQLHDEGFNVLDETAALGGLSTGRVQRTDAQVIDIARAVEDPPIDAAVVFSIHASAKHAFYQTRVIARIPGRLLNVKTGERLGEFQIELPQHKTDRNWYAKSLCRTECIVEVVGKNAAVVAEGLGGELAERLSVIRSEEAE